MKHCSIKHIAGLLLSSYYGGRVDAKIRREILRVLVTDFVSLYPTIAVLAKLWRHVISQGFTTRKVTSSFQRLVSRITLNDLQDPVLWSKLNIIARVKTDGDVLPARGLYQETSVMRTIGINYAHDMTLWYTAYDIIASKLRTGKAPKILEAIEFVPRAPQPDLQAVRLVGADRLFNPYEDDFFKFIIELRAKVKKQAEAAARNADQARAEQLLSQYQQLDAMALTFDDEQKHLKVEVNSSYGFFVEMNEAKLARPTECEIYSYRGREPLTKWFSKVEEPGIYFHPLVGTMITGGARLMLMVLELLAEREGVRWMLCDTDSMAFARPEGMSDDDFVQRVNHIRAWFEPLNPYRNVTSILKLEDVNFKPGSKEVMPLYGLAIAPKSYALFNLNGHGDPILREAKQFLLENYIAPYSEGKTREKRCFDSMKLRCWQRDVWLKVIRAFLDEHPDTVDLSALTNFDLPAARKISISTANVEAHVRHYNNGKPYRERIRPSGFLLSFTPKSEVEREYLAYEHNVDRRAKSALPPRDEARYLFESACLAQAPFWGSLRDQGGRIIPDIVWDRKLRRWKRALEFADVPRCLLAANSRPRSETAEIVYGNIDEITQGVRERSGNFDLTTSDVLEFFAKHRRPPSLRDFQNQARENTYGWSADLRPLAPFDPDIAKALQHCFNAQGDRKVETYELKTYGDVFHGFHLRPEYKYANAAGTDRGETQRRYVTPSRIDIIGKESVRYARQDQLSIYEPAQLASEGSIDMIRSAARRYGVKLIAKYCGKSDDTIRRILNRERLFSSEMSSRVSRFVDEREMREREDFALLEQARLMARTGGLRVLAVRLGVRPGRLSELLSLARRLTSNQRSALQHLFRAS